MSVLNNKAILLISLLLSSCVDLKDATNFDAMVTVAVGEDISLETDEDKEIKFYYEVRPTADAVDLDLNIEAYPKNGILKDCFQDKKFSIECAYIPNPNFNGLDIIKLRTSDGDIKGKKTSVINIKVNSVFDAPVGNDQPLIVVYTNTLKNFKIIPASTIENEQLVYELVDAPVHGDLSGCLNGLQKLNCVYKPHLDYIGEDEISFRAIGKESKLATGIIKIPIKIMDLQVPVGPNQQISLKEDTPKTFTYTVDKLAFSNDLTVIVKTQPLNGTLACTHPIKNSLNCTYSPKKDFYGTDQIILETSDGIFKSDTTSKVDITVESVYDNPVLVGPLTVNTIANNSKAFTLPQGTSIELDDPLTYQLVKAPLNGTITGCFNNTSPLDCTYIPTNNYVGNDSFIFSVKGSKSLLSSNQITAQVVVSNLTVPVGTDQEISLKEDTSKTFTYTVDKLAHSKDLTVVVKTQPLNGTLACTNPLKNSLNCTYSPKKDFYGTDQILFQTSDGIFKSDRTSKAVLTVESVYDNPDLVGPLSVNTTANNSRTFTLPLGTSIELDDPLTYQLVKAPLNGTITGCFNNNFFRNCTFVPNNDYVGNDSFIFSVKGSKSLLSSNQITAQVVVSNLTVPVGIDQQIALKEDTPKTFTYTVDKLAHSKDLAVVVKTQPLNGTLACTNPLKNSLNCTYSPKKDFYGTDQILFETSDGTFKSDTTSKVDITVESVYDNPVLSSQNEIIVAYNTAKSFLIQKATTIEDELLEYHLKTPPLYGTISNCLTAGSPQSINCIYTPTTNFSGNDQFTFYAKGVKSALLSANITVNVKVSLPNTRSEQFAISSTTTKPKVSLLLVVDDSASMASFQGVLANKVQTMIEALKGSNTEIFIVTTTKYSSMYKPTYIASGDYTSYTLDINRNHIKTFSVNPANTSSELTTTALDIKNHINSLGTSGDSWEGGIRNAQLALQSSLLENVQFGAIVFLSNETDYSNKTAPIYTDYKVLPSSLAIKVRCVAPEVCPNPFYKISVPIVNTKLIYGQSLAVNRYTHCSPSKTPSFCHASTPCNNELIKISDLSTYTQIVNDVQTILNLRSCEATLGFVHWENYGDANTCTNYKTWYGPETVCTQIGTWKPDSKIIDKTEYGPVVKSFWNTPGEFATFLTNKFGANNFFYSTITHLDHTESCSTWGSSVGTFFHEVASSINLKSAGTFQMSICAADYSPAVSAITNFIQTKTANSVVVTSLKYSETILSVTLIRNGVSTIVSPTNYQIVGRNTVTFKDGFLMAGDSAKIVIQI